MNHLSDVLQGVKTAAIAGHVNPDGDCVGSCMGLYLYLKKNYPDIQVDVYLEKPKAIFHYISDIDRIHSVADDKKEYDTMFLMDVSSLERVGVAGKYLETAGKTVCIDHHVTNSGICTVNHIVPDGSSTCEVLYQLLDPDKVDRECAEAIYTGMIHDTGVFQYSCTTPKTMRIAAELLEKGIRYTEIIEKSFYQKTYVQNQIMGRTLMESIMVLDGKCIIGIVRLKEMQFYGIGPADLEGIVNQLRNTAGVEVAMFLYELEPQVFKVSLRSTEKVDVSVIAGAFGGGGHIRAAGCTMSGTAYDVVNNITLYIEKQLTETEKADD